MENIGKRFGHRVIIAVAKRKSYGWKRYVVRCDCGSESEVEFSSLKKGKSTQCGLCARRLKRRLLNLSCLKTEDSCFTDRVTPRSPQAEPVVPTDERNLNDSNGK